MWRRLTPSVVLEAETVAMVMTSGSVLVLSVCRETKGAGCVFPLRLQNVTFAAITWNRGISAERKDSPSYNILS